jgi:hypothetical protein
MPKFSNIAREEIWGFEDYVQGAWIMYRVDVASFCNSQTERTLMIKPKFYQELVSMQNPKQFQIILLWNIRQPYRFKWLSSAIKFFVN